MNKSDYLSKRQREFWHDELVVKRGLDCLFFSAFFEQKKLDDRAKIIADLLDAGEEVSEEKDIILGTMDLKLNGVDLPLTRQELLAYLREYAKANKCKMNERHGTTNPRIQFGMVGFPNVGKSSVINVLMGNSKHSHGQVRVGVASQPGKTKHFQTLLLPDVDDMMLCDCPGLVFPSFVNSKADLIAAGVYPIQQMRDFWPVVNLIVARIPREILNAFYAITLPVPRSWNSTSNELPQPTGEELLKSYCVSRSLYASGSGQPHYQQASRIIIKDYVEGKLLYCHPPPFEDKGSDVLNTFFDETLATALQTTKKLRENLVLEEKVPEHNSEHENQSNNDTLVTDNSESISEVVEADDLLDILEAMDGLGSGNTLSKEKKVNTKQKKHRMKKPRAPKKGKRDKDPYGCHPDEGADIAVNKSKGGLCVNAGKYSSTGYTRLNYSGARAAVKFQATKG